MARSGRIVNILVVTSVQSYPPHHRIATPLSTHDRSGVLARTSANTSPAIAWLSHLLSCNLRDRKGVPMRLLGTIVLCLLSGMIGGFIVFIGILLDRPMSPTTVIDRRALIAPVVTPVPSSASVLAVIEAFRSAGLEVGLLQEVTADSPCHYPSYARGTGVQFNAGSPGEGFCVLSYDSAADGRTAFSELRRLPGGTEHRMTVKGNLLLVYVGSQSPLSYRYETVLLGLH